MTTIKWTGIEKLTSALASKSRTDFERVAAKNANDMIQRSKRSSEPSRGGTPVDTGALRSSTTSESEGAGIYYGMDYAPPVEFGHRSRSGRFIPGQYYLRTNTNIQRDIYKNDLLKEMRRK